MRGKHCYRILFSSRHHPISLNWNKVSSDFANMADKRKELTEDEKKVIVSMNEKGMSARSIAECFGRSNSCISRVLRRFRERGTLKKGRGVT